MKFDSQVSNMTNEMKVEIFKIPVGEGYTVVHEEGYTMVIPFSFIEC